jgi:hypothetical protein
MTGAGIATGIGAAIVTAFVIYCFTAYLEPTVFIPALNVFSLCK